MVSVEDPFFFPTDPVPAVKTFFPFRWWMDGYQDYCKLRHSENCCEIARILLLFMWKKFYKYIQKVGARKHQCHQKYRTPMSNHIYVLEFPKRMTQKYCQLLRQRTQRWLFDFFRWAESMLPKAYCKQEKWYPRRYQQLLGRQSVLSGLLKRIYEVTVIH